MNLTQYDQDSHTLASFGLHPKEPKSDKEKKKKRGEKGGKSQQKNQIKTLFFRVAQLNQVIGGLQSKSIMNI